MTTHTPPLLPSIGSAGWVALSAPEFGCPIYVRFAPSPRGLLERREVVVLPEAGDDPYSPAMLRQLAALLERLKIWANSPEASGQLLERLHDLGPDPRYDLEHLTTDVHKLAEEHPDHPLVEWRLSQLGERPPVPRDAPGPQRQRRQLARRARLVIPEARPYPDEFYERVAELYTSLAWRSGSPAKDIADEYEVPVRTVHGWIAKARHRGYLSPEPGQGRVG